MTLATIAVTVATDGLLTVPAAALEATVAASEVAIDAAATGVATAGAVSGAAEALGEAAEGSGLMAMAMGGARGIAQAAPRIASAAGKAFASRLASYSMSFGTMAAISNMAVANTVAVGADLAQSMGNSSLAYGLNVASAVYMTAIDVGAAAVESFGLMGARAAARVATGGSRALARVGEAGANAAKSPSILGVIKNVAGKIVGMGIPLGAGGANVAMTLRDAPSAEARDVMPRMAPLPGGGEVANGSADYSGGGAGYSGGGAAAGQQDAKSDNGFSLASNFYRRKPQPRLLIG